VLKPDAVGTLSGSWVEPLLIPNNERKVCDAVVRLLEVRTGEERENVRYPEEDGVGPPVDVRLRLGAQEFAVEHTLIESFEGQIKVGEVFGKISGHLRRSLSGGLPRPAFHLLRVPVSVSLPQKKARRNRALESLVNWIREGARYMDRRSLGQIEPLRNPFRSDNCIREVFPDFACEMELWRWPNAILLGREPGDLDTTQIGPEDEELEKLRAERLKRAYSDKCPKLERAKAERARTVLVLENEDIALASFDLIGSLIPMLRAEPATAPDEIYLAETHTNPWWVWLMKCDGEHWPSAEVPEWNQRMNERDELPTPGMPHRCRDSPGLDDLSAVHVSKWKPASFDQAELNDLSKS